MANATVELETMVNAVHSNKAFDTRLPNDQPIDTAVYT